MRRPTCPSCHRPLTKNGSTTAGTTRWRCRPCSYTTSYHQTKKYKQFRAFISWICGTQSVLENAQSPRSFRRNTAWCWQIWPVCPHVDERYPVVFIDGIYLGRKAVILIASTREHVIGWYFARTENTAAYRGLLSKITPPDMVISDGGNGFAAALRLEWPDTHHQRCLFHAYSRVRQLTTSRPKTQAGRDLLYIARLLLEINTPARRDQWLSVYGRWRDTYKQFLAERSVYYNGQVEYTHQRLRRARRGLDELLRKGTMFTYLESYPVVLPAMNNRVESVNARLRELLHRHRGLSLLRRAKLVMWWCYMHSPQPRPVEEIVDVFPRDADLEAVYRCPGSVGAGMVDGPGYGQAVVWWELHRSDPFRLDW